jgi:chaperonin GroEL
MKERKARVEDALHATRAAVEEGIVAGGGLALVRAGLALANLRVTGDERHGVEVVRRAISAPMRQIAENAGYDGALVVAEVEGDPSKMNEGFDAVSGEYVDMFEAGIVDPTKVVRTALENAASAASVMLSTDTIITDLPEEKDGDEGPRVVTGAVH